MRDAMERSAFEVDKNGGISCGFYKTNSGRIIEELHPTLMKLSDQMK